MLHGRRYSLMILILLLLPIAGAALVAFLARNLALRLIALDAWFFDAPHGSEVAGISVTAVAAIGLSVLVLLCLRGERAPERRLGERLVFGLSILGATALSVICVIAGARRANHPPVDVYLGDLESRTHEIPAPGIECPQPDPLWVVTTRGWRSPSGVFFPKPPLVTSYCQGPGGIRMLSIGGLGVLQLCTDRGCQIELAPSVEDLGSRPESTSNDPLGSWREALEGAPQQEWDDRIRFVRERSGNVLYLQDHAPPPPGIPRALARRREFHLLDGRWRAVDFSTERVAEKTSAPSAWLWTGLAGLVLSGMLVALRRRVASRRRVLEAARPAVLGEEGRLTFEDGTVARMDPPAGVPSGPVLVLRQLARSAYRESVVLSRRDVLAGRLEERLAKLRFDLLRCDAATVAVAWLAAAPLGGAAMVGLVA